MADSSSRYMAKPLQYLLACGLLFSSLGAKGQETLSTEDRLSLSMPVTTYFHQQPAAQAFKDGQTSMSLMLNYNFYSNRNMNFSVGLGVNERQDNKHPFGQLEVDIRRLCDQRNFFSVGVAGGFYRYYTKTPEGSVQEPEFHTMGNAYARCNLWNDNSMTLGIRGGIAKAAVLDTKFIPTLGLVIDLKKSGP